jgi:hypothetical protein
MLLLEGASVAVADFFAAEAAPLQKGKEAPPPLLLLLLAGEEEEGDGSGKEEEDADADGAAVVVPEDGGGGKEEGKFEEREGVSSEGDCDEDGIGALDSFRALGCCGCCGGAAVLLLVVLGLRAGLLLLLGEEVVTGAVGVLLSLSRGPNSFWRSALNADIVDVDSDDSSCIARDDEEGEVDQEEGAVAVAAAVAPLVLAAVAAEAGVVFRWPRRR